MESRPWDTTKLAVDKVVAFSVVNVPVAAEKFPDTPRFPVRESVVFLSGVYPNAVVMSEDDIEKVVVRFDSPSLVSVRVLWVACGVENDIAVT